MKETNKEKIKRLEEFKEELLFDINILTGDDPYAKLAIQLKWDMIKMINNELIVVVNKEIKDRTNTTGLINKLKSDAIAMNQKGKVGL